MPATELLWKAGTAPLANKASPTRDGHQQFRMAARQGLLVIDVPGRPPEEPALGTVRESHVLALRAQHQHLIERNKSQEPLTHPRVCVVLYRAGHSKVGREHAPHHVVADDHVGRIHVFEGRVPVSSRLLAGTI